MTYAVPSEIAEHLPPGYTFHWRSDDAHGFNIKDAAGNLVLTGDWAVGFDTPNGARSRRNMYYARVGLLGSQTAVFSYNPTSFAKRLGRWLRKHS